MPSQLQFNLTIRKTLQFLLLATLLLVIVNLLLIIPRQFFGHGRLLGLGPLFDMDAEFGVAAFFSSFLIMLNACVMALLAYTFREHKTQFNHWIVLAIVFAFLSVDELCSIHERAELLGLWLSKGFENWTDRIPGFVHFAWELPYLLVLLPLGLWFIPFLKNLPRPLAIQCILAGLVYLLGAAGFEVVGGILRNYDGRSLIYDLVMTCEETLEMLGMILFFRAIGNHLAERISSVSINIDS